MSSARELKEKVLISGGCNIRLSAIAVFIVFQFKEIFVQLGLFLDPELP